MKKVSKRFFFSVPLRDRDEKMGASSPSHHSERRKSVLNLSQEESKEALFSLLSDKITASKHGVTLSKLSLPDFKVLLYKQN